MNERNSPRALANRRNAVRSTGPKTAAGKARSSKNAIKHGLAMANASSDSESRGRVAQLANEIAGPNPSPGRTLCAQRIAAATIDLEYIRVAQRQTVEQNSLNLLDGGARPSQPAQEQHRQPNIDLVLLARLSKIERYAQRATARLKRAIRALDDLLAE